MEAPGGIGDDNDTYGDERRHAEATDWLRVLGPECSIRFDGPAELPLVDDQPGQEPPVPLALYGRPKAYDAWAAAWEALTDHHATQLRAFETLATTGGPGRALAVLIGGGDESTRREAANELVAAGWTVTDAGIVCHVTPRPEAVSQGSADTDGLGVAA